VEVLHEEGRRQNTSWNCWKKQYLLHGITFLGTAKPSAVSTFVATVKQARTQTETLLLKIFSFVLAPQGDLTEDNIST